ncbi:MAG: PmoA family protein [Planctomycetes bacterium]|nr:PmoA family protein [Planctomycetota bacterium]
MKPSLRLAAVLFAAVALATPSLAGPLKITTGELTADYGACVLEFEIRGVPETKEVTLTRVPGGEAVPCQVKERSAGAVRVAWLAPALEKATEAVWEVDLVSTDAPAAKPRVEVKAAGTDVEVLVDGKALTRLVADPNGPKPYLFPLLGPNGKMITRRFPMEAKVEGEEQDHPHQRSLWLTHGDVNGIDFWAEGRGRGTIRQTKVESLQGGPVFGRIATRNEWLAPDGRKLLDDARVLTFYPLERGETLIDVSVTLSAAGDEPVVFGDTKEGSFGVRLAESMKGTRGGVIVSSRGLRGGEAWGKPAEWVDYSGKVGDDLVGVAIFDHPSSFRHPTHWHVRPYGLFAANPFGYRDFYDDKSKDGSFKLEKGKTIDFRYRVYLHHGGSGPRIEEAYRSFAKPPELKPKGAKA